MTHDPALKGVFNGNCNREACQLPGATWYNLSTRAYYCGKCATEINSHTVAGQLEKIFGYETTLCVPPTPVWQAVAELLESGAVHTRTKIKLNEISDRQMKEHGVVEMAELFEAFGKGREAVLEEIADVYGWLVHVAMKHELPWRMVEQACTKKFKQRFTLE